MKLTKKERNAHGLRANFAFVTQHHLYSTAWCWGFTNFKILIGGKADFSGFRYHHVGIPNAKFRAGGSKPTPGANTNVFAPQWNIGFRVTLCLFWVNFPRNCRLYTCINGVGP